MNPSSIIHIAMNIDSRYVRFCSVTLASIFENNRDESFFIHIICNGLSSEDEAKLIRLTEAYHAKIHFYVPDEKLLEGFAIRKFSKRISIATYYRCFLADVLPLEVERVIYLDCDILVLGQLRPLWNSDLRGKGIAVVRDVAASEAKRYEILHYPLEYSYFNAGVFLADLGYWRGMDVTEQSIKLYHEHPERIIFNDQDILNILFCDKKMEVAEKWNMQDGFYRRKRTDGMSIQERDLREPVILHFTNRKPWEYDNQHPLRSLFFTYQNFTEWKDVTPFNAWGCIKRFFRLLPFYLHLRKPKYIKF